MSYTLTITTDSLDELYNAVSNLRGKAECVIEGQNNSEPAKEKKIRAKKDTTPTLIVGTQIPEDSSVNDASAAIGYEQVSKVTLELKHAKGKPAAIALLDSFGVETAAKLPVEKFAEYVAAAKTAIARV